MSRVKWATTQVCRWGYSTGSRSFGSTSRLGYETKASAEKGIEAIKTHAAKAKVEDNSDA
jgi:hypothetical protein